ncbi:A/G-specific adenine glycosylase [Sphingomonas zeicaulis]|uniref:A/G-specific adenine glycosylase n=1 Tax=Sphingomonas zeicaulis TaxID=1632740 RepID=UPI003D215B84
MSVDMKDAVAPLLLAWYDANARRLPWRSPPGTPAPEPYRVWLSEIMLQQTTVAAVIPYFERFTARWPTVDALAAAEDAELMGAWAGLGYYARARNLLACARAVAARGGFPQDEAGLLELPGVGAYTAAAVAAIAFDRPATVVDGNVERVVARLFAVDEPMPAAKPELRRLAATLTPARRAGDFAQAMMDLGATICTPRSPSCLVCPISAGCAARATGDPARFPVKVAKKAKPQRHGTIFWIERAGDVLLVRRPDKGLLGGMRALPTGPWADRAPGLDGAPAALDWRLLVPRVSHVFTHFALDLSIAAAALERDCAIPADGEWWPRDRLEEAGLPTVFMKAARAAREDYDPNRP